MLGLPKKVEKKIDPIIEDVEHRRAYLNKNGCVLVPTMAGSHMVLMPRPGNDKSAYWPESIPGVD